MKFSSFTTEEDQDGYLRNVSHNFIETYPVDLEN